MGYESLVIVVDKTDALWVLTAAERQVVGEDAMQYFYSNVVAIFDCRKLPEVADFFRGKSVTDCAFYFPGDGDMAVLRDKYGDRLREARITDLYDFLRGLGGAKADDRAVPPLYEMLGGFQPAKWGNLRVLHYGH